MIQTRSSQLMLQQTRERNTEPLKAISSSLNSSISAQTFSLHQRCYLMNKILRGEYWMLLWNEKPFIQALSAIKREPTTTISQERSKELIIILERIQNHQDAARRFIFNLEHDILNALKPYGLIEMLAQLAGEIEESLKYLDPLTKTKTSHEDCSTISNYLKAFLPECYQTFMMACCQIKAFMEHATAWMMELSRSGEVKRG